MQSSRTGNTLWLANGRIITSTGIKHGAIGIRGGNVVAVKPSAPKREPMLNVRGQHIAPGLIDLHVWGDPDRVARDAVRFGTTSFLTALGPESPERLVAHFVQLSTGARNGARCLGVHLEGPFLNPLRAGALASRWLRPPTETELRQLARHAAGRLKLLTLAPELPGALEAIRWCARRGIVASLGHSDANDVVAERAVAAGARAVTHVFNGMRPLHHRDPGLLGEALTNDRLTAMVILDGAHVTPMAFQLLWRCRGPQGIALVTDSVQHYSGRPKTAQRGAYYIKPGVLAGSRLTMIRAVRNAVVFGKISLHDAVQMATVVPARLLGEEKRLGSLAVGRAADLVVFDQHFRVSLTMVGGHIVYQRK